VGVGSLGEAMKTTSGRIKAKKKGVFGASTKRRS